MYLQLSICTTLFPYAYIYCSAPKQSSDMWSQLKHQNMGCGSCIEWLLKWLNYPHASVHPQSEVSWTIRSTHITALLVLQF